MSFGNRSSRSIRRAEPVLRVVLGRERVRVERSQFSGGMSKSKPGRTMWPCGSVATSAMNAAVVPRDPVEPATMTGCAGGASAQRRQCSTASRWRRSGSGGASVASR
jgi:hypothetical protein